MSKTKMATDLELDLEQTLRRSSLLSVLTDEQFRDFLAQGESLNFQLGDMVATAGQPCDGLYFLVSGKFRRYAAGDGGHVVTHEILSRAGEFFGAECWQRE